MVVSNIFVDAPTGAIDAVEIISKKNKYIVSTFFTFNSKYFVVFLTQTRIETVKTLIFNFFFFKQKPITITHQNLLHFFSRLHIKKKKKIQSKMFLPLKLDIPLDCQGYNELSYICSKDKKQHTPYVILQIIIYFFQVDVI